MSVDVNWDIDKYKEDHESDEHWQLRRCFMERWKNDYPEERLVCLARVFANIEFMGCRYPTEVMQEVAMLSKEVAQQYRNSKKGKLQRTFVSASDAAEDRAKGIKRQGGVIVDAPPSKSSKILFVPQGQSLETENREEIVISDDDTDKNKSKNTNEEAGEKKTSEVIDANEYLKDMEKVVCLDVRLFNERMFETTFGRMVLLIRPWACKLGNIYASCQACGVNLQTTYEGNLCKLTINGQLLAQATGPTKIEAKAIVEIMAWNRLKEEVISILVKERYIADGDRISVRDVTARKDDFGTPVENSVATKMMKLMGWKGGGLGADAQGIAEPIRPTLQMVNRAGLGSECRNIAELRLAGSALMRRYRDSSALDVDLVFSSEFSKEERAALHHIAQRCGLASRSHGQGGDRFLVVNKKLDPFSLVRAVIDKGGCTPKYQVFIPIGIERTHIRW